MLILKLKNILPFQYNLIYSQLNNKDILILDYGNNANLKKNNCIIESKIPFIIFTDIFIYKIKSNQNFYYCDDTILVKNGNSKIVNILIKNDIYDKKADICLFSSYYKFIQNYNLLIPYKIKDFNINYNKFNTLTIIYVWKKISFFEEIIDNLINSIKNSNIIIILLIKDYQKILKKYDYINLQEGPYFKNINDTYQYIIDSKLNYLSKEDNYKNLIFIDNNIGLKEKIDLLSKFVDVKLPVSSISVSIYNTYFNNLWLDRTENGYFKKSQLEILDDSIYISYYANYIIYFNKDLIRNKLKKNIIMNKLNTLNIPLEDFDIMLSNFLFNNCIPIYLYNYKSEYGYIIKDTNYHNDPYENLKDLSSNRYFWMKHYLSPNILKIIYTNNIPVHNEPIPYLYELDFFSKKFCTQILSIAKKSNIWSSGKNNDNRLTGGYEAVPTVDTHLNQLGLDNMWDSLLHKIIAPIVKFFYLGIETKDTNISFIVKYSMDGQKKLKPHHDSSSYTVNIALNNPNEYEGGGTRFIKSGYVKKGSSIGTMLLHPGRVTHYHEGLPITKGERYILVAFIN
jgi:hypothetical protein